MVMKASNWVERLRYLASNRKTYYDNTFPGNCGEINADGSISFDCIGMVKSVINEPDIVYKKKPAGYYVKPGQVIPDTSEAGILAMCSGIKWGSFNAVANGEYLYMEGHAGVYFSGAKNYNVIECTPAWKGGVQYSWVDPDGTRRQVRGGWPNGKWEAHGKLSGFIDYDDKKKDPVRFKYCVFVDNLDIWLDPVINTDQGFAGIVGDDIKCVKVKLNKGHVHYAVHTWKGDAVEKYGSGKWLPEVTDTKDYAGVTNQPADAFYLKSDKPARYRVRLRKTGQWLPWVYTKDANKKDPEKGYAGIIGQPFDGLQIQPL